MTPNERRTMLGQQVSPAFEESTKLLGHQWHRPKPAMVATCTKCGCVSKDPDERWLAPCPVA